MTSATARLWPWIGSSNSARPQFTLLIEQVVGTHSLETMSGPAMCDMVPNRAFFTYLDPIWMDSKGSDMTRSPRRRAMTAICVRREKAALSSGCKSDPANAPAGSNRSSHGGDESAEAFGVAGSHIGDARVSGPQRE